jgi:alkaline phosphatase D
MNHRSFRLRQLTHILASLGLLATSTAFADAPLMQQGIQLGDLGNGSVVVWSRSDRESRMMVETGNGQPAEKHQEGEGQEHCLADC